MPTELEVAARVMPSDVVVVEGPLEDHISELHPSELEAVRSAVESRRQEFSTGRALSRIALARLGVPTGPITRGREGEPQWPAGVTGTIAHTRSHCAVAVATTDVYASLGLDIEVEADVRCSLAPQICTPAELRTLERHGRRQRATLATIFSAKECFYKCQYPLSRRFLDFHDVEVELGPADRFWVRPRHELGLLPGQSDERGYPGTIGRCSGLVVAGMMMRQGPARALVP